MTGEFGKSIAQKKSQKNSRKYLGLKTTPRDGPGRLKYKWQENDTPTFKI